MSSITRRALVCALLGLGLTGAFGASAPTTRSSGPAPAALSLRAAIAQLWVANELREGYSRDKFAQWVDADHDGCDTRAEVLLAEAITPPVVGKACALTGGRWRSPYDDVQFGYARALDIDHVVPLAEAWDSGAYRWTATRRKNYANDVGDPRSLIAVSVSSNRSKADQDPATWVPPYQPFRCAYLADWVAVKTRWGLAVDPAEKTALDSQASDCPNVTMNVVLAPA